MRHFNLVFIAFLFSCTLFAQNHCLQLDGVDDYIHVENFQVDQTFTMSVWIKPSATSNGGNDDRVLAFGPGNRIEIGVADLDCPNGQYWTFDQLDMVRCYDEVNLRNGIWHNLAIVADGPDRSTYLDGALLDTYTTGPSPNYGAHLRIGAWTGSVAAGTYYSGLVDEVRIWDVALTAEELNETLLCELNGDEPNLIAYYHFNQGVAGGNNAAEIQLNDATAFDHDGELMNFSLTGITSNWVESDAPLTGPCITGTQDLALGEKLEIYPNPAGKDLHIRADLQEMVELQVFDAFGKRISQSSFRNAMSIDVSGLAPGIYFLQISSGGSYFTTKFVKL